VKKIDSHHHFWQYNPLEYGWISESMAVLRRDFLFPDLEAEMKPLDVVGVVSVQARQTIQETRDLLQIARTNPGVLGVVGWVPLASDAIANELEKLAGEPLLKGVRHVVQDEPDNEFILGTEFNRGVSMLAESGLIYDILIFARQLQPSIKFVDQHPDQRFILDHIAKPTIVENDFDKRWAADLRELGRRENVTCKFSGVATEVRDSVWSIETIRPYWDVALESFGAKRLMFGSDWPVCLLKTQYNRWVDVVTQLASELSPSEQAAFWYDNAVNAYGLVQR
jgi:L-fuconolactonase